MDSRITRRDLLHAALALPAVGVLAGCASRPGELAAAGTLADLDATATAAAIRRGEFTAREAVEAAILRAQALEPRLNAIVTEAWDRARATATAPLSGPYAGVPTFIKDLDDVRGLPTRYGSRSFGLSPATNQGSYVDALERAGLVILGKSATPEFGFTASTEPLLHVPTRNPWNPEHTTGGSSGGSAALVAARVVPVASATDGGGSIRIPASCCGLFGLKPSRGRTVATGDPVGPVDIVSSHAVTLSVRDSAQWLALTEQAGTDAVHAPVGLVRGPGRRRLRIALDMETLIGNPIDAEVRAAIEDTARRCESLGHRVEVAPLPLVKRDFIEAFLIYWSSAAAEIADSLAQRLRRPPTETDLEPWTLGLAQHFRERSDRFEHAIATLRASAAVCGQFFTTYDVLLTPVVSHLPPRIGELAPDLPFATHYERVLSFVGFTPVQNASGTPAMSVPLHWSNSGLPIGSHFAAKAGDERTLLELAYELEVAHPWAGRRPPVAAT